MVPGDEAPLSTSMTMEEIEAEAGGEERPKADLDKTMAEGDEVPEAYRGKSVSEIIRIAETARSTMNESVTAAREAAASAARAAEFGTRREEAPPPPPPKDMTREELKALYDEDPLQAIQVIEDQAMRRVAAHVEERIAPLTAGTMGAAENWAKQEYPDEFALFGDKITAMVDSIPNKQVFSSKKGWEDAISYVRGQKGNFEKLVDHRATKTNTEAASTAREKERSNAGFSGRNVTVESRRESSAVGGGEMSKEEESVAQRFIDDGTFKDMAEYKKWQRMGG